jgi:hypothetical protein
LNTQNKNKRDDCSSRDSKYMSFADGGNADGCSPLGMYRAKSEAAKIQIKHV